MRRRIGGNDLHGVAAVRQKAGVERTVAVGEVILQQQPARFAVAAVIDGVDKLVVVIVVRRPPYSDRVAVANRRRRRVEARLPLSLAGRLAARHMRNGLVVVTGLHDDLVDFGSDVLGQVVQQNIVNARRRVAGMEYGLPLHEARRRNAEFGAAGKGKINTRPLTPVAVGIVHIAAARIKFGSGITGAADAGASPKRKYVRVEDIAFIRAFGFEAGTEDKNLSQVAAGSVESSARRGGEGRDLRGAGFDEIGVIISLVAIDGKNVAAIAGAGEQASVLIEAESVDEIFVGTPQARRGAIGRDAINLGAAGGAEAGSGKWRRHDRRGGSGAKGDIAARYGRVLRWRRHHDAHLRHRASRVLFSRSGGVDIARAVDGQRRNFFLGRAVENERFAIRRNAIDQPAAIGARNQVSF